MEIITGYTGQPHVTAGQDRQINRGTFGEGDCVMNVGSAFKSTIESANSVTVADGVLLMQGCAASISDGASQTLTFTNGTSGYNRIDLIAAVYRINTDTSQESVELEVIEGTPTSGTPTAPTYDSGNIADGATHVYPIYEVKITGVAITEVKALFSPFNTMAETTLWLNASPSSQFEAQKIKLDLSKYDSVKVGFAYSNSYLTNLQIEETEVGKYVDVPTMSRASTANVSYATRTMTVAEDGINFGDCSVKNMTATTGGTVNNTRNVPVSIKGMRKVDK